MVNQRTELRSVFLDAEDIKAIDALAKQRDISRAKYCRRAIEAQLQRDRSSGAIEAATETHAA